MSQSAGRPALSTAVSLAGHRLHCRRTGQRSTATQQSRKPYESWLTILLWICGLPAVLFFKAPVPSGCTLTLVLSRDAVVTLIEIICSSWSRVNTLSRTPLLLQRFMRVYMECQFPKCLGNPRHLQPCSRTYKMALITCRLSRETLPRCRGKLSAMRRYCSLVICIPTN